MPLAGNNPLDQGVPIAAKIKEPETHERVEIFSHPENISIFLLQRRAREDDCCGSLLELAYGLFPQVDQPVPAV